MRNSAMVFAGISGCLAVILGAVGAHALTAKVDSGMLSAKDLHGYETAAHYQLLHSLAILALVALSEKYPRYNSAVINLFMAGTVLFSGSIYLLVAGKLLGINLNFMGPVTPAGGLCFIAGWFMIFLGAIKKAQHGE